MKNTYIIIAAILVIVIIIGGAFAYISLSSSSKPTTTPTPTASPTAAPTGSPTASPTAVPTAAPTTAPTATPTFTAAPTPTPTPAPFAAATVNGEGGTLVAPLMSVWIGAYSAPTLEPQITVNYNPQGSGAGITAFTQQIVNFGESDAPMTAAQYTALPSGTTALTIPITASAVVPAYHVELTNGSYCQNGLNFTGTVLGNIFLGTVTTWNDSSIQALQSPSIAALLPNTPIITIHRSD